MSSPATSPAATWARGIFAVFIIVVVMAVYPNSHRPAVDAKYLLIGWGALLFALMAVWAGPRKPIGPILMALIVYGLYMAITGALSQHPGVSLNATHQFAAGVVIAWAASRFIDSIVHLERIMLAMLVATFLGSVYALFQFFGLDPIPWEESALTSEAYTGLPGPFGNANLAAHALALCIVVAIYFAFTRRAILYAPIAIVFAVHLYRTGQRGAWVALAAALVICAIVVALRKSKLNTNQKVFATFLTTAFVGIAAAAGLMGLNKLATGYALPVDSSVLLRYNAFYGAAQMVADNPILGIGFGNYAIENPPYWTPYEQRWYAEKLLSNFHVHNDLLESGAEGGIPGIVFHLMLFVTAIGCGLYWTFSGGRQKRSAGMAVTAWFTVFFVDGFFGFNMRVPATAAFFFIMCGSVDGVDRSGAASTVTNRRMASFVFRGSAAIVAIACALLATVDFHIRRQFKWGVDLRNSGYADRAVATFESAIPYNYWDWQFQWEYARALSVAGRDGDAIQAYDQALARSPYFAFGLVGAAQTAISLMRTEPGIDAERAGELLVYAQTHSDRARTICPDLSPALEVRGRSELIRAQQRVRTISTVEQRQEAYRVAAEYFRRALLFGEGRRSALHLMIHLAMREAGDEAAAEKSIRRAIAESPQNDEVWMTVYENAMRENNPDRFRTFFMETVETVGNRPPFMRALYAYYTNGPGHIIPATRTLLKAAEDRTRPATDRTGLRGYDLALAILADAAQRELTENADRGEALRNVGETYLLLRANIKAAMFLEAALPLIEGEDAANAAAFLADFYLSQGRPDRAVATMQLALPRAPDSPAVWLMLARSYSESGDKRLAAEAYRHLLNNLENVPDDLKSVAEAELKALGLP